MNQNSTVGSRERVAGRSEDAKRAREISRAQFEASRRLPYNGY